MCGQPRSFDQWTNKELNGSYFGRASTWLICQASREYESHLMDKQLIENRPAAEWYREKLKPSDGGEIYDQRSVTPETCSVCYTGENVIPEKQIHDGGRGHDQTSKQKKREKCKGGSVRQDDVVFKNAGCTMTDAIRSRRTSNQHGEERRRDTLAVLEEKIIVEVHEERREGLRTIWAACMVL